MFHKFLLSQAINIASLTIAELIRKHHSQFDIEAAREKIHTNIRIIVKPNFLGEKNVEDKVIKAADWMLNRVCDAMESGADVIGPVLNAASKSDWTEAVNLLKSFAKGVLRISDSVEASGSDETEFLVGAYLEENPGEAPSEEEESQKQNAPQAPAASGPASFPQGNPVTDSMQDPASKLAAQQGQQPFIKGNEIQPFPPEVKEQKKEKSQNEGEGKK